MEIAQLNTQAARSILSYLKGCGVREVCLCPSSRNAPLIVAFQSQKEFRTYLFFEERSASYFALGRIQATQRPVAVVVTSGTAVGELLPATMEAYYSNIPLILVTADRMKRFRGSGAPQTAHQPGLFGRYVLDSIDYEPGSVWKTPGWVGRGPLHLNACFDEPFLEVDLKAYQLPLPHSSDLKAPFFHFENLKWASEQKEVASAFFNRAHSPLVIVGRLQAHEREAVSQCLLDWRFPTYFEGLSGLREDSRFSSFRVHSTFSIYSRAVTAGYLMDGVIRIGGVPTARLWRDLEETFSSLPVLSLSSLSFSGLARQSYFLSFPLECLDLSEFSHRIEAEAFLEDDRNRFSQLLNLFQEEPKAEPSLIHDFSVKIPKKTRLFLGNSQAIRHWDLGSTSEDRELEMTASRGLNGIEGQISTFYGFSESNIPNWGLIGDLTALYDLAGPWILPQLTHLSLHLVVINNRGGQIFSRLFEDPVFLNSHAISFEALATFWKMSFEFWENIPQELDGRRGHQLIELCPDLESTDRFWKAYQGIYLIRK